MIQKNNIKKRKSNHGGARPGAGAKKSLEAGGATLVYLDDPTRAIMSETGEGELSRGIRLAGIVIELITAYQRKDLIVLAKRIESKRIKETKEAQREMERIKKEREANL